MEKHHGCRDVGRSETHRERGFIGFWNHLTLQPSGLCGATGPNGESDSGRQLRKLQTAPNINVMSGKVSSVSQKVLLIVTAITRQLADVLELWSLFLFVSRPSLDGQNMVFEDI